MSHEAPEYHDADHERKAAEELAAELGTGEAAAKALAKHLLAMGANRGTFPVALGDERFTVTVFRHA